MYEHMKLRLQFNLVILFKSSRTYECNRLNLRELMNATVLKKKKDEGEQTN